MSRQISSIKCEQQNIYIKQEHNIDESTEYNDSNDGEFTYQCYRLVQDSKYTTENVEAQIKTEVNIIDSVKYESSFKRENYNYDPSIIMCQMPTTYCIKIEPTNCNLNTKASTINLTPPKHKTALYKKKQYFSQIGIKSEKPYKCGICNKSFSLKGTLKTHLSIHMKDKPYKCFICNKSFSQASTLITHKVTHNFEKPFNCDICKKSFAQKVNMKTHMMFHMGDKSNKKTCNKTIISLNEFYTKTLTDEKPYKSVIYNKLLSEGSTLSVKQQFKCHICCKSFYYKGSLKTHLITHMKEKPYKCHICSKTYSQKGNLKTHLITHMKEEPYKCNIYSKSYSQKGYMKTHMMFHMGEKSNNKTCNKTISLKGFYTKTLTDENPYKSVICNKLLSEETTLSVKQQFKCHVCSKSFPYKATLKTHLIIHTGEKPHKCHICSKSFYYKGNLKTHLITHMKEKPYKCHICSKSYSQKGYMKIHMEFHMGEKSNNKTCNETISLKEFHTKTLTDENPYKSIICNKLLSEETTLSVKQQFKCHVCSKSFPYKATLKTHLIIHTEEKPHKCHICSKSFYYKGNLKTHLIIHMKEKPYKCHICSKSYSQKGNLKIHTRIHTRENP